MEAKDVFERQYLMMRKRVLDLAADLDRLERGEGGLDAVKGDARFAALMAGLGILGDGSGAKAERFQMLLSDVTAWPKRNGT